MYADMLDTIGFVAQSDAQVARAMQGELCRQRRNIELIASENVVSPAVMAAMGSVLTNKYAEGYPGQRYYGGCAWVDEVEDIARERACRLFGAQHANVQPHSGAQANLAVYFALLNVGDTVLGMDLSNGGHLTHGSPVNMSGKNYRFVPYGVDENGYLDYEDLARKAREHHPKLVVAGASAYARTIDFERIGRIAKENGALFMVDMAHIAGLVAAGLHPSPVPYADVVTTTPHKTLRGPGVTGKELEARLDEVRITANKNTVPNDPASPFVTSGLRIGTPAVTTRGFGEAEMEAIARFIADTVFRFEETRQRTLQAVQALTERFPLYE